MNDDDINFYVVILSFTILILYLNYLQNRTVLMNDWENVKCNPLYLFFKSIGTTNTESSKDFQTCISTYGKST